MLIWFVVAVVSIIDDLNEYFCIFYISHFFLQDPFVGVSEKYKQALGEDEHRLLTGFFSKSSADTFLLEMHEFLVLVLKNPDAPDTYRPNWG